MNPVLKTLNLQLFFAVFLFLELPAGHKAQIKSSSIGEMISGFLTTYFLCLCQFFANTLFVVSHVSNL